MELHEVKIGDIVTYKDAFKRNIVGKVIHRHDGKQNAALANHINIQKLDGKPSYPTTIHVSKVNPFVPLQDKKGKKQSEAPMKVTKEETETISELNKKTMQAAYKERLEREHDSAGSIGSDETAHDVMPKSLKTREHIRRKFGIKVARAAEKKVGIRLPKNPNKPFAAEETEIPYEQQLIETIADLLLDIEAGNNVDATQKFNDIIAAKQSEFLDAAKLEVASQLFDNTVSEEDEIEVLSQDEFDALSDEEKENYEMVELESDEFLTQDEFDALSDEEKQEYELLDSEEQVEEAYSDPYAAKKAAEMKKKREEDLEAAKKEYESSKESTGKINTRTFMVKKKTNEEVEQVDEALKGKQKKLDANHNGKLDAQDFKMLRARKTSMKETFDLDEEDVKVGSTVSANYGPNKGKKTKVTQVHPNKSVSTEHGHLSPGTFEHHKEEFELEEGQTKTENKGKKNKFVTSLGRKRMMPGMHKHAPSDEYAKVTGRDVLKHPEEYGYKKEEVELEEASYSAKRARMGKDLGKKGKNFAKISKSAGKKYGSKAAGQRVAGAILKKLRNK